jgi:YidC/Oxa1 family membrane protein insertase
MDKKNLTIGVTLLLAAVAVGVFGPHSPSPTTNTPPTIAPATAGAQSSTTASTAPATSTATTPVTSNASGEFATVRPEPADAGATVLSNDYIDARLTEAGGAVLDVALKRYPKDNPNAHGDKGRKPNEAPAPYVFNAEHDHALLALVDFPGADENAPYELVSKTKTEVVYRRTVGNLEITRLYRLDSATPNGDPYRIRHETTVRNLANDPVTLPRPLVSVGTAELVNLQDYGMNLNVTAYDGKNATYIDRSELAGGGIGSWFGAGKPPVPSVEKPGPVVWAGVKNQFFASIFTPDTPAAGVYVRRIQLGRFAGSNRDNIGITGAERFDLPALAGGGSVKLSGELYVGPREYKRLASFQHNEDAIMQYARGFSKIFLSSLVAPLENTLLNKAHQWLGNWRGSWGVAVIIMTLILKFVSLPFTLAASRSAKRMSKLQPQLKEIREKYKDNPQKQQAATMELFKANKVNPVGGCIPVLITMPLFFGFYAMLYGTPELRFQPFLWATDLSAPDTIGTIAGFPINIMPLLMGITMIFTTQLTPTPSVDKAQATMMKFMPVMFIAFCYNFSCALALYSTINGLFTIVQQLIINKLRDDAGPVGPGTAAATTAGAFVRPVKNVTPKTKK